MATELIPDSEPSRQNDNDPSQDANHHAGQQTGKRAGRNRESPSISEILDRLDKLAGLAALGLMKPAVVNSMRACYADMLRALQQQGDHNAQRTAVDDNVLAWIRANPKLGAVLEPFLSAEQIKLLMAEADQTNNGQT